MVKRLLTIQDVSCVGQCSATVALPVISACGVECAVLPSAVLSNHTGGFKSWSFHDLTPEMPKIESEWKRNGLTFDAFYTGYVCANQIDPILSICASAARPGALRFVDPAMADNGRLYAGFADDFPREMARLVQGADYVLPNLTEAALLLGETPVLEGYDEAFVERTVRNLMSLGARTVVLTGVSFRPEELGVAVYDGREVRYDFNPRLRRQSHGTGDVFASVFAGAVMRGFAPLDAAALAADVVCDAISATAEDHWYGVSFESVLGGLARRFAPAS